MAYVLLTENNEILSVANTAIPYPDYCGALSITQEQYQAISSEPQNYVYLNNFIQRVVRPSAYHTWNKETSKWVHSDTLLTEARKLQWEKVKEIRDTKKYQGFKFYIDQTTYYWMHSDPASRIHHLAFFLLAVVSLFNIMPFPSNKMWKTLSRDANNQPVKILLTPQIAMSIFSQEMNFESQLFELGETHRLNIEASLDPNNYNILDGWPEVYTGEV